MAILLVPKTSFSLGPYEIGLDSNNNLGFFYNNAELEYLAGSSTRPDGTTQGIGTHMQTGYYGEVMSATLVQTADASQPGIFRRIVNRIKSR